MKYCVKEIYKEVDISQKDPARAHSFQTDENQRQQNNEEPEEEGEEEKASVADHNNSIKIVAEEGKAQLPTNINPAEQSGPAIIETKDKPICRICQGDDNTQENPLISPCRCSGSIKFVHVGCMQEWYRSKLFARVVRSTSSYSIKGLECELCKQKFSMTIEQDGKLVDLLNVCRPKTGAYIVVESLGDSSVTHIHITAMENKQTIRLVRLSLERIG